MQHWLNDGQLAYMKTYKPMSGRIILVCMYPRLGMQTVGHHYIMSNMERKDDQSKTKEEQLMI